MRKKQTGKTISMLVSILLLLPLMLTTLAACSKDTDSDDDGVAVQSLTLDTTNVKIDFAYGETFTYDNLKVSAKMVDETIRDIPITSCKVSSPNMTSVGRRTVLVKYKTKSARYTITVSERSMAPIDSTSLVDIVGENEDVAYRVEAESINMAISGVKAKTGETFVADSDGTTVTSNNKYLTNFGVADNYFGFTFTADKAYDNVIMVARMAYNGTENLPIEESMEIYKNYAGTSDTGKIDISGKTVRVDTTPSECYWQDLLVRELSLNSGVNTLTFGILSESVPNIDYFDFYVGKRYINSVVPVTEATPTVYKKEFEDFDLERIVNRQDMIDAHNLKPGQCYLENPSTNLANTSNGSSAAGFTTGTEISTTIRLGQNTTINIIMVAASVDDYKVKDNWKFYINGMRLRSIEDKNIKDGSAAGNYYWQWQDTNLGNYNLAAGDHILTAKLTGSHCNADIFKFKAVTLGSYDPSGSDLMYESVEADIIATANGTYKAEAENCDLSNCVGQGGNAIITETPINASNSKSLGRVGSGSKITIAIRLDKAATLHIYSYVAKYEGGVAENAMTVNFNGTGVNLSSQTITAGYGDSDNTRYFNWASIDCGEYELDAGVYVFEFTTLVDGLNLDCFSFVVTGYNT